MLAQVASEATLAALERDHSSRVLKKEHAYQISSFLEAVN